MLIFTDQFYFYSMMKIRYFIYGLFLLIGIAACSDDKNEPELPSKRTVLVYMAADNNLSSFGYSNIEAMVKGAKGSALNGGNLLVYFDPKNAEPQLLQIKTQKDGSVIKEVIKDYPNQNSASSQVMRQVINDVIQNKRFEAESYGLMLWSHGTAWLPYNWNIQLRSFGQDGSDWMEIPELEEALPDNVFDFIIFDACYMASMEVVYDLRKKANYFIGSPTEVLANGFPYSLILEPMFRNTADLVAVCDKFFNYYDQQTGVGRSATVSLVSTKELEALRTVTRGILKNREEEVLAMPVTGIQPMDYLSLKARMLYDFDDFIKNTASEEQYADFETALNKAVIYKKATPKATYGLGGGSTLEMKRFSGLSIYIPQEKQVELNDWYRKNTEWYQAVYK